MFRVLRTLDINLRQGYLGQFACFLSFNRCLREQVYQLLFNRQYIRLILRSALKEFNTKL